MERASRGLITETVSEGVKLPKGDGEASEEKFRTTRGATH